ncbi:hypothetical protein [Loktanella sp. 3ANDIMAR09]|uniref:hypothetical protein n=1 Tax=Loktanella sp. 3ANDIMAR09 TaxID=1225657 RepID=UPI0006F48F8C|nr:hypothetical protein [Loktanella sp. 3ANDIMAR09]
MTDPDRFDETRPQSPATTTAGDVVAKLRAYKAARDGDETCVLPQTGITVTFPKFRSHGQLMKAQRLSKGDSGKAGGILAINICRFDGQTITLADFDQFPMGDTAKLLDLLFEGNNPGRASDDDEADRSPPQY